MFDVVVVGGGIVGASLAVALAQAGTRVAVIEPRHPPELSQNGSVDSRVYTVSPGNAHWLERLGVWKNLRSERITRVETMKIYGDLASGHLEFNAYDAGMRELAFVLENRELQHALWTALEPPGISLYTGTCETLVRTGEGVHVGLRCGASIEARLIVGADGAESWVRHQLAIVEEVHDYGQIGVVANFAAERPHYGTAFQWFRDDGILALLPLPTHGVSMVWSTPEKHAHALLRASPEDLCSEVSLASQHALGSLEIITPPAGFPLRRQRVERLVEHRAALIGDAAHNVHPLAGQGVNLGLRDAYRLAEVLSGRGPHRDCGDHVLLRRFERARKEDIYTMERATDGLEKLFSARGVLLAGLRNIGLTALDRHSPLKTLLVRRASA